MSANNLFSNLIVKLLYKLFALPETQNPEIEDPKRVLIVRQHNQFGDLLASVSLFRAVKETYPDSHLTVIVSPQNFYAVTKNKYIDKYFIYNQKKLLFPFYLIRLINTLKNNYDLVIVPATVSISSTSCILGRLAKSKLRVGPKSLNGKPNQLDFLFDVRIDLNWMKYPDSHISDFGLDILRPLGITTKNYRTNILIDDNDLETADKFVESLKSKAASGNTIQNREINLIGFHIGAGKPPNRWSLDKFIKLANLLNEEYNCLFYITGSSDDGEEINYIKQNSDVSFGYYLNKSIPELAALISISSLFVTNDTGVMHVAGATETPQVSIFGPTNPFNWAPLGSNKYFIRKSDLIDDVTVNDVYGICKMILGETNLKEVENVDE